MATKEEVLADASITFGRELTRTLNMDPREAAEGAYLKGGPSVDELERRIREMRARLQKTAVA